MANANTYFMWCMRHEMINSTSCTVHLCNHGLYYFAIIILPRTLVKGIKAVSYVVLSHEMYPQGVQPASTLRAIPIKQYPYFAIFIAMDRFNHFQYHPQSSVLFVGVALINIKLAPTRTMRIFLTSNKISYIHKHTNI